MLSDGAQLYKLVGSTLFIPEGCYFYPDDVIELTGTTQEDCLYQCQVLLKYGAIFTYDILSILCLNSYDVCWESFTLVP